MIPPVQCNTDENTDETYCTDNDMWLAYHMCFQAWSWPYPLINHLLFATISRVTTYLQKMVPSSCQYFFMPGFAPWTNWKASSIPHWQCLSSASRCLMTRTWWVSVPPIALYCYGSNWQCYRVQVPCVHERGATDAKHPNLNSSDTVQWVPNTVKQLSETLHRTD